MKYLDNQKQQGFSLIEVMIALVIGMILLGGAINIFISNNNVYRLESELSRMQESGRFLIDFMSKEIRMAGYAGCSSREDITPNVKAFAASMRPGISLGNNRKAITGSTSNGNDAVAIQRASECKAQLTADMATIDDDVQVTNACNFAEYETVIITDCISADVFTISAISGGGSGGEALAHGGYVNEHDKLSKNYDSRSQVHEQLENTFYIANGASGEPAVWMSSWDSSPANSTGRIDHELADGVEKMQILYGEDTGGNEYVDVYVDAGTVRNWTKVRSVRINLLLRSDSNITTAPQAFTFNGANANSTNDTRLRMAFSTTVSLRNRLP